MENAKQGAPRGADAIVAYFRRRGWSYEQIDEHTFASSRPTPNGSLECLTHLEMRLFTFHALFPFVAPQGKLLRLAQFATLANHRMPVGTLDLDLGDGEIGFRTSLAVEPDDLTPPLVAAVVEPNLAAAARLISGVAVVSFSDVAPQAAIEQVLGHVSIADAIALASELLDAGDDG